MKSVIAQGSTVSKAIEEALKKAGMPNEFFIKLLEDAQAGFLGFGSKKAKIALFFKHNAHHESKDAILSQDSYENLFNNQSLKQQIDQQLKDLSLQKQKLEPKQIPQPQQKKSSPTENKHSQQSNQKPQHQNFKPRNRHHFPKPNKNTQQPPTTENKMTVRPLPIKKNDPTN